MIILAHDGSLYGDWIAHYAVRFAAAEDDRKLLVLHVLDGKVNPDLVRLKLDRLAEGCRTRSIDYHAETLPFTADVYRSLRHAVPHDPDALLLCGTRVKAKKQRFLSGTIAEKLLRIHQCPVLALRVVQPGLLGAPHELLLPLAGHAAGATRFWPVLRRLLPELRTVHLFRVLNVHYLRHPHLSRRREEALRQSGLRHLDDILAELNAKLPAKGLLFNRRVAICSDWASEVLVQADRLKVQMVLLGVSERSLAHRVLHGIGLEQILRETSSDIGIYRGP